MQGDGARPDGATRQYGPLPAPEFTPYDALSERARGPDLRGLPGGIVRFALVGALAGSASVHGIVPPQGETAADQGVQIVDTSLPSTTRLAASEAVPVVTDAVEYGRHTITSGQTFIELEQRNNWPLGTLQHLNPGVNPRDLQIGEHIITPGDGQYSRALTEFNTYLTSKDGAAWANGSVPFDKNEDHVQDGDFVMIYSSSSHALIAGQVVGIRGSGKERKAIVRATTGVTLLDCDAANIPYVGRTAKSAQLDSLEKEVDPPTALSSPIKTAAYNVADPSPTTSNAEIPGDEPGEQSVSPSPAASSATVPADPALGLASASPAPSASPSPAEASPTAAPSSGTTSSDAGGSADVITAYAGPPEASGTETTTPHPRSASGDKAPADTGEADIPGTEPTPSPSASTASSSPSAAETHPAPAAASSPEKAPLSAEQQRLLDVSAKDVGNVGITASALAIDSSNDGSWCAKQVLGWYKEAGIPVDLSNDNGGVNFGPRVGPTHEGGSLLQAMQENYSFHMNSDTSFTPQVGDLVFFEWTAGDETPANWSQGDWHVGMVIGVEPDGTLITREGASNGPDTGDALGVNQNHWTDYREQPNLVGFARILNSSKESSVPTSPSAAASSGSQTGIPNIPGLPAYGIEAGAPSSSKAQASPTASDNPAPAASSSTETATIPGISAYAGPPANSAGGAAIPGASSSPQTGPSTSETGPESAKTPGFVDGVWKSGETGPYTMEKFSVSLLQALAQFYHVPESQVLTQQHVYALVAWFEAEGGNAASDNFSWDNPANTGLCVPGMMSGPCRPDGTQAYASFDDGIMAYLYELTGTGPAAEGETQVRIGQALVGNTTAAQVAYAICFYDKFSSNNKAWAWGTDPDNPNAVLQFNHTTYYDSIMKYVQEFQSSNSSYVSYASYVIGAGQHGTQQVSSSSIKY